MGVNKMTGIVIYKHYLKRIWQMPLDTLGLTALPLLLWFINTQLFQAGPDEEAYVVMFLAFLFMASFQFFSMSPLLDFLYTDFQGVMRLRLGTAPCTKRSFVIASFLAAWTFALVAGGIFVAVTALGFGVNWGNLGVVILVIALLSTMAQLIAVLLFFFTKTRGVAEGMVYAVGFGVMILSGGFGDLLGIETEGVARTIIVFLSTYGTPVSLARNAMIAAGNFEIPMEIAELLNIADVAGTGYYLGILGAVTVALGLLTYLVVTTRKKEI